MLQAKEFCCPANLQFIYISVVFTEGSTGEFPLSHKDITDELSWNRLPCCVPLKKKHEALICSLRMGVEGAAGNLNTCTQGYSSAHVLSFRMPAHFTILKGTS